MRGPPTAKSFITQHKYCTFRHRNWSWLELIEEIRHAWRRRPSIVITLLADGKRDGEPVALRRERAGRVGSVGTGGVLKTIEIEHELAGFIEAVGGEAGIQKAAGTVRGADDRGESEVFVRGIGNPSGGHTIGGGLRVPVEFAETDDSGRRRILDA